MPALKRCLERLDYSCCRVARPARRPEGIVRQGDVKNGMELAFAITAGALLPGDNERGRQP